DLSKHDYWIEIGYLKNPEAYKAYTEERKGFDQKYDREVERTLEVVDATGIERPDFLNMMYYPSSQKAGEAMKSPEKKKLDQLYRGAVAKSIWFRGTAIVVERADPAKTKPK